VQDFNEIPGEAGGKIVVATSAHSLPFGKINRR